MDTLFLKILNISITASWIVLAVIAVRFFIKKAPKFITCFLWIFVAIRLICPFSFESVLSLIPSTQTIPDAVITEPQFNIDSGVPVIDDTVNPYLDDHYYAGVTASANTGDIVLTILGAVWLAGMIIMLAYMIISYLKVRKQVSAKIRLKDNIFICDEVKSPFIMGIFRPEIYLPSDMNEEQREYVLSHELAHIKRHDNLWKPLGFILLSVYWFNPLMWLAYILLSRDIESACDEKVIKDMTDEERAGYSQALLDCGTNRKSIQVCPVAFGETGVKERVKNILNYKKPAFWIIIIAVIASIAVAVCFLTNPKTDDYDDFTYEDANIKITENLPPVLEISPYMDFKYREVRHGIFFIEHFKEIKVTYDEESFADAKKQIEDTISFRGDILLDSFGETVFDSISADIFDCNFRIAALSESVYPKNFWIIGMNEKDKEIIYIQVDAQDLDNIDDLEDFLCDDAKIPELMVEKRSHYDDMMFKNKKGKISLTYVSKGLDAVVGQVILAENADKDWLGECHTEGHIILGSEENGNKTKIYTLTSFNSFGFENGYFTDVGGNSMPVVITVDRNTGAYSIRYAEDGEYYPKSIKKMFPPKYQSRAFGDNEKDGADMWKQCVSQAEEYLESIGRKAEVKGWGEVPHIIFTDIGMPVEISNRLEDYLETYQFYNYLGYEEIIEDGTRYVYRTSHLTDKDTLLFSKEIYGKNQVISLFQMNIKTGYVISLTTAPEEIRAFDFIDAEVVDFKDNILTVKAINDGTQYKIDTSDLSDNVKPDSFYEGLYLRIYCTSKDWIESGKLIGVRLIAVLGDIAEYGGTLQTKTKEYTTTTVFID